MFIKLNSIFLYFVVFTMVILTVGCHQHIKCFSFHHTKEKILDHVIKKLIRELDLNDTQKTMLTEIKKDLLLKHGEMLNKKGNIVDTLVLEIKSEQIDEQKLNRLFEQKIQHMNELCPWFIAKFVEFHNTLTPEQKEKLASMITKYHNKSKQ